MKLPLQLDELQGAFEQAKLEAESLTAGLTGAGLWQQPSGGGWSVGECLVHLNLVGEPYLPKLRAAVADARAEGRTGQGPFKFSFSGAR